MRPLRILHALTHANVTRGGAIQALLLARGQLQAGHQVEVLCNADPREPLHPTFQPWQDQGVPIHPYHMHKPLEYLRVRKLLKRFRPDVIHVHRDDALRFCLLATAGGLQPGAFISQRGTTHALRNRLVVWCHRHRRVDRIIAVAHAVKDALVGFGIPPAKVAVVYGSFDTTRFDPALADRRKVRRELGLGEDDRLVVQVGALHPKKSPTNFLRTAAQVVRERPGTVFALVGDGSQRKKCKVLLAELQLGDRVRMMGFRTDIADVYAASDIAVNSSIGAEGLTGALREALAMARPVVATRVDGNPEAVRDGETGILVPPRDPSAAADAIVDLLDHPDRGQRLGAAGRRLILENMHEEVRLARTEAVYRDVLAQNGHA